MRRKAKNKFKKYPTQQNLRSLRIAENRAKEKIKDSKTEAWRDFSGTINLATNVSDVWKKIKSLNNVYR